MDIDKEILFWIFQISKDMDFEVVNMKELLNHIKDNYIYTSDETLKEINSSVGIDGVDMDLSIGSLIDKYCLCCEWVELVNGDWLYLDEIENNICLFKDNEWVE